MAQGGGRMIGRLRRDRLIGSFERNVDSEAMEILKPSGFFDQSTESERVMMWLPFQFN